MIARKLPGIGAVFLTALLLAGCAGQRQAEVDPIFKATPNSGYNCAYAGDNRNAAVKAATSKPGQAALGGILGGLIGNQFGSNTGRDIATGAGAAAGAAGGAWNADRMQNNRRQNCLKRQQRGNRQKSRR